MSIALAVPANAAKTTMCHGWMRWVNVSAESANAWHISTDCVIMTIRRLLNLSATTPDGRVTNSAGSWLAIATTPSSSLEPVSVYTSQGRDNPCIHEPVREMS